MKRSTIFILGLMILGVSACKKVTEEYYTNNTIPNKTVFYQLSNASWTSSDGGKTHLANLNFVNSDIYLNTSDGLLVYISYDNGANYISIPQTYNGLAYSFSASNQKIFLEVQSSDYNQTISNPGVMTVKVVMIPSEQ